MKKGHYTVTQTRTSKHARIGWGKIHLGLTPGGQRTVCKCENNVWVELMVRDRDPKPLSHFKLLGDCVCKLCLDIAERTA